MENLGRFETRGEPGKIFIISNMKMKPIISNKEIVKQVRDFEKENKLRIGNNFIPKAFHSYIEE